MFKFITCILLLTSIHAEDIETDKVTIATISSKEGDCKHTVTQGDRVYLFFSGIEHNSGQVFDTNRGLGSNAFIMRVGEPNVLPAFQEGLLGACEGDKRFIEIPASKNNNTQDSRVSNIPLGVALDFEVEILLVVPKAAIKVTDRLLLKMRKSSDVTGSDVEEAITAGMPVNVIDTNGRTLLVTASFTANMFAVEVLLKHGADPNLAMHTGMTAAIYAAGEGHVNILRLLLKHGAKTDASLHLHGSSLRGYTALHFACLQGRTDSVKLLLEYGGNPGSKEEKGLTPLAVARSILIDGTSHKGLKPRDRERGKKEFDNIKVLMVNALVELQQREMKKGPMTKKDAVGEL